MTRTDEGMDEVLRRARALYNEPRETPREEMWRVIAAGLEGARARAAAEPGEGTGDPGTITPTLDLSEARARRRDRRERGPLSWAVAAAALLVLGVGIGRMSAPASDQAPVAVRGADPVEVSGELGFAAREHLGRTESLLTLVRADARDGRIDPAIGPWARALLSQTRLLMDARGEADPAVHRLLEDLELVLIQIAGVGQTGALSDARASTELELAIESLNEGEVLSRLHAVIPMGLAGT